MVNACWCRVALSSPSMAAVPCGSMLLFNYTMLLDRRQKLIALCNSVTVHNWEGAESMYMGA